jgi:glutamate 5-kinase
MSASPRRIAGFRRVVVKIGSATLVDAAAGRLREPIWRRSRPAARM